MYRRTLAMACLLMAGCATYGTMDEPDDFVRSAVAWEGRNIRDMISHWGQPNDGFTEPSQYINGMAKWKNDEMEKPNPYAEADEKTNCSGSQVDKWGNVNVNCRTYDSNASARRQYELGRQAGAMFRRRCFVAAEFDETGAILKVVASSQNCS